MGDNERGNIDGAHMKASVSAGSLAGFSALGKMARSKVAVSGPCGVMHRCKLAPVHHLNPS